MSKIKKIQIHNFKAISDLEADFNGCTAIIIGGNNKGKSSLLSGLPDRIRGVRPNSALKSGSTEGSGTLVLDTGEKFVWEFNTEGKDKLTFHTTEGYKTGVTKEIAKKFFPPLFDVDAFLEAAPKEQSKILQKLVGVDFTAIDQEYKLAYDARTEANKTVSAEKIKFDALGDEPEKVEPIDVIEQIAKKQPIKDKLAKLQKDNKAHNDGLRTKHTTDKETAQTEYEQALTANGNLADNITSAQSNLDELVALGYDGEEVKQFIGSMPQPETITLRVVPEPEYIDEIPDDKELQDLDTIINNAALTNDTAQKYTSYQTQKQAYEKAVKAAETADSKVKDVEFRKNELIQNAKFPEGITLSDEGILVDGLPFEKSQLSTSKIYCTALRLASLNLGQVRTLHFDASPLDKVTLGEIQKWAEANDCQLLIERVDPEAGDIRYEIVETL